MIILSLVSTIKLLNISSEPLLDAAAANEYQGLGERAAEYPDTISTVVDEALQQAKISATSLFHVTCAAGS